MNQKKQARMSVNKLIAMILGAVILILIITGLITGQLNPLFKNLEARMDNALAKLGFGNNKGGILASDNDCQPWEDAIGISPKAQWRFCTGYCELKSEKNYLFYPDGGKISENGIDVSNLLDFDARNKIEFQRIWDYKAIERGKLTKEHLELYDKLIGIYKFPGTRKVVVREERTYRIQEDFSTSILLGKHNKFISFFLPKKLEYRWKPLIDGAPYLNPDYSLTDLENIKKAYNYLDPEQNGKCK